MESKEKSPSPEDWKTKRANEAWKTKHAARDREKMAVANVETVPGVWLTARQDAFVQSYSAFHDARRAAEDAGYEPGYGKNLLQSPQIRSAIKSIRQQRLEDMDITAERAIEEMGHVAFYDPRNAINADGDFVLSKTMDESVARAISGIAVKVRTKTSANGDVQREVETNVRFHNKTTALEQFFNHFGLHYQGEDQTNALTRLLGRLAQAKMEQDSRNGRGSGAVLPGSNMEVEQPLLDSRRVQQENPFSHEGGDVRLVGDDDEPKRNPQG